MSALLAKIERKAARIVVIGLGYVGLPLALELARAGFRCTGLERDPERVRALEAGESYIPDVATSDLRAYVTERRLDATSDARVLAEADVVIVCVPTPLNKTKDPDMRFIVGATDEIARHQHDDMLVILESTTYPGTTNELLIPKLTTRHALGQTIHIAFSPERVDPGNTRYTTRNTPKVIGGATPACLHLATALYSQLIAEIVPVSSPAAAEMVKLLENTFRAVNIGLANEIALMSRKLGVDPFEVIGAAATKPFGFMPFFPGPGLGGHCIPIDPLYLSWRVRKLNGEARLIDLADSINSAMPAYVVERTSEALNDQAKPVRGSQILIYGVAYKKNVTDYRESPALAVLQGLEQRGARVAYLDPLVPHFEADGVRRTSLAPSTDFGLFDAVVLVTDHDLLDRERLAREARVVVDMRGALRGIPRSRAKVYGF